MSFRFGKRVGLLGGLVHLNLSLGGVSVFFRRPEERERQL